MKQPIRSAWTLLAILLAVSWFLLYDRSNSHLKASDVSARVTRLESRDLMFQDYDPSLSNSSSLHRRDYTCGPGNPCSNGACCGESGYCGYGDTYCGAGCSSNCNAKAECGQYSDPPGKTCPLNTCCSQYGFCGTTEEFCETKCQSNCVTHPSPPGGGSGQVLQKVIGYYESWSARSKCHKETVNSIALDALTHLNFAFAYIDPSSFEITTMDSQTPSSLFKDVANAKVGKPDLQVYISVGGWTFSDNGTATQPVFGNIASSEANRQKFASNVIKFIDNYGFDGIDIDWEYPGAPDRGGKPEDVKNFVALLKTLRENFDGHGKRLGLTFTTPSSYWYLRWFDLPGLLQYADWTNLMTYDLHGTWDRNNPIGSIVQAHTNLTEIKLATELFWRVGIPPAKISMGFGFYGRSFELADAGCSTPGCQFTGGAAPGPCSDTSGILAYYEIQELIKQKGLKPVHDEEAAVQYIVFDNTQWVSFDDAVTFKQKVDWANSVGLSGALIWASDLDDDKYTAHSGLLGRSIAPPAALSTDLVPSLTQNAALNIAGQAGQDCYREDHCDGLAVSCTKPGYSKVGGDIGPKEDKCKKVSGLQTYHGICCPKGGVTSCRWRGDGGDCNGQCHPGETTRYRSSWGGFPRESGSDEGQCSRGVKVFCCDAPDYEEITEGCRLTGCGYNAPSCNSDEEQVGTKVDGCLLFKKKSYCCKKPSLLYDCTWRGRGSDCVEAKCQTDEVGVFLDKRGGNDNDNSKESGGGACYCLCDTDEPGDDDTGLSVRAKKGGGGKPRPYDIIDITGFILFTILSRSYYIQSQYFTGTDPNNRLFETIELQNPNSCTDASVFGNTNYPAPAARRGDYETEHPVDLEVLAYFITCALRGVLPSGATPGFPAIPANFWTTFFRQNLPELQGLPNIGVGGRARPDNMNDRLYEAFGSKTNPYPLILAARDINQYKARIFNFHEAAPVNQAVFLDQVRTAINTGTSDDAEVFLTNMRDVLAVFQYLQRSTVRERFLSVRESIRDQFHFIHTAVQQARNVHLQDWWNEFEDDYFQTVVDRARTWVADRIIDVSALYTRANPAPANAQQVLTALRDLHDELNNMRMPQP